MIATAVASLVLGVGGCAADGRDIASDVPIIEALGTRPAEYTSVEQLAGNASAIVVVTPTGKTREEPLPQEQGGTKGSAPTLYLTVKVERVLSGSLDASTIDVVSPGTDKRTAKPALAAGRAFLLFITPAMYAADRPAGGYAIVGGPAGMYASTGATFAKVDTESPQLPNTVDADKAAWPTITLSEADLLHRGPR